MTAEAPEHVASTLRDATVRAWEAIVRLALDERVDFLVVAGDAFENANRTLRGQVTFLQGLRRLGDAGIGSYVVTGNHDPLSGWEPGVAWPETAYRFDADAVRGMPVMRAGAEIARVYGISYPVRDVTANLARRFRREPDAPFAIGLLHANVGGQPGHQLYAPCSVTDLRAAGMDYWALGHIHRPAVLSEADPTVVYCGNPQGRDPGEMEPRGCFLVSVDSSGSVGLDFRAVDVVRWRLLHVSIDRLTTEEALVDAITDAVERAQREAERAVVARVELVGRGPLHATLQRGGLLADLRGVAQEALGLRDPFAWIESVRDATRPELDLAAARREATGFLAEFLRDADAARGSLEEADPESPVGGDVAVDRAVIDEVLAPLYEHQRARRVLRDRRPDGERLAQMLSEAETLVVDRLAGGR